MGVRILWHGGGRGDVLPNFPLLRVSIGGHRISLGCDVVAGVWPRVVYTRLRQLTAVTQLGYHRGKNLSGDHDGSPVPGRTLTMDAMSERAATCACQ